MKVKAIKLRDLFLFSSFCLITVLSVNDLLLLFFFHLPCAQLS